MTLPTDDATGLAALKDALAALLTVTPRHWPDDCECDTDGDPPCRRRSAWDRAHNLLECLRRPTPPAPAGAGDARLSAALVLIDELRGYTHAWDWKYGEEWDRERARLAQPPAEPEPARGGDAAPNAKPITTAREMWETILFGLYRLRASGKPHGVRYRAMSKATGFVEELGRTRLAHGAGDPPCK